jgi:hypothetical protein
LDYVLKRYDASPSETRQHRTRLRRRAWRTAGANSLGKGLASATAPWWNGAPSTALESAKFVDFVRLFDIVDMNSGQIQEILPVTAPIARKSAKIALTANGL